MAIQFPIGDKNYVAERLDTFKALHVARRLAPIVGQLALATSGAVKPEDMVLPLMEGIAEMKDEDFDYVRDHCLAVVRRVENGQATPIFNRSAKMLQFADITPRQCLEIIISVVVDNLSDFLGDLPNPMTGGQADQASPQ